MDQVNRELAQKPHEPHAAFWHCAKPRAEIKFEITENPSRWKGSWIQGQVQVGEEISFVPQLLCARRDKYGKSEWSWTDDRKNGAPRLRIDQIPSWMNAIQCHRDRREH
jgi:hypothetical protein